MPLVLGVGGVVLLLVVLIAAATATRSTGGGKSSEIPAEFRTPLGCDSRDTGFCQEQSAIYKACDYSVNPNSTPTHGRDPYNGGSMTTWSENGQPMATSTINVWTKEVTLRAPYCEVTVPLRDYLNLKRPGTEADLPPALR